MIYQGPIGIKYDLVAGCVQRGAESQQLMSHVLLSCTHTDRFRHYLHTIPDHVSRLFDPDLYDQKDIAQYISCVYHSIMRLYNGSGEP